MKGSANFALGFVSNLENEAMCPETRETKGPWRNIRKGNAIH